MTGGEGGYEDIGLGAFDRIVIHTGVHGFQNRRVLTFRAASDNRLNK